MKIKKAQWITPAPDRESAAPIFRRIFASEKTVEKAELHITALAVVHA